MRMWKMIPLLAGVLAVGACEDDTTEPDVADSVVAMRLVIGAQTITIDQGGTITGGPVTIPATGATITATFLNTAGQSVTIPTSDFQLNVGTTNAARVTFTRTAPFTGTINRVSAGTATLQVSLYHTGEEHDDFGPFNVPVTLL